MADIKCSKCGNVAQPGGFLGKDYKKWDGEIVCDSCYTQLTKATIEAVSYTHLTLPTN